MSKTGGAIAERILDKVNEPDFTIDDAIGHINDCAGILSNGIHFAMLEQSDTVVTVVGEHGVALPEDFQRNLFYVRNMTRGTSPDIAGSVSEFRRLLPEVSTVGSVSVVCVSGGNLQYFGIPTLPENLDIMYHRKPAIITELGFCDFTSPDNEVLIEKAFFHYGCKELYDIQEEGVDGKTPNTDKHDMRYQLAVQAVSIATTQKSFSRPPISRGCFG